MITGIFITKMIIMIVLLELSLLICAVSVTILRVHKNTWLYLHDFSAWNQRYNDTFASWIRYRSKRTYECWIKYGLPVFKLFHIFLVIGYACWNEYVN